MSTPGAIGVYREGGPVPEQVSQRAWEGVYHHYDGGPSDLGNHLLRWVEKRGGDLHAFVRELVDEVRPVATWSCLWRGEKSEGASALSSTEHLEMVAFCYVLDLEDRRLDVFATHADAVGERLLSVHFADDGTSSPRFMDLVSEELVEDQESSEETPRPGWLRGLFSGGLGGRGVRAAELSSLLAAVLPIWSEVDARGRQLEVLLVSCEASSGGLEVRWRVVEREGGVLVNLAEFAALVVPDPQRFERARVEAFVRAWARVAPDFVARMSTPFQGRRLFDPCALERAAARTEAGFERVLRSGRYLG